MNTDPNLQLALVSGPGMILVAAAAVIFWRRVSRAGFRWLWIGAGLWTIAVAVKVGCALVSNAAVIGFLQNNLPYSLLVVCGGLFVGLQSSLCEMGFTLLAVWNWRVLGRDAGRAIAVGVGAGAFEAVLLGLSSLVAVALVITGLPGTEPVRQQLDTVAATTPLFWLVAPAERVIAILYHASSRALVLLGVTQRRWMMVFWGFAIFTLLDGIAGAAHVSGKLRTISIWWIELAILPFGLVSIAILVWCYRRWGEPRGNLLEESSEPLDFAKSQD